MKVILKKKPSIVEHSQPPQPDDSQEDSTEIIHQRIMYILSHLIENKDTLKVYRIDGKKFRGIHKRFVDTDKFPGSRNKDWDITVQLLTERDLAIVRRPHKSFTEWAVRLKPAGHEYYERHSD